MFSVPLLTCTVPSFSNDTEMVVVDGPDLVNVPAALLVTRPAPNGQLRLAAVWSLKFPEFWISALSNRLIEPLVQFVVPLFTTTLESIVIADEMFSVPVAGMVNVPPVPPELVPSVPLPNENVLLAGMVMSPEPPSVPFPEMLTGDEPVSPVTVLLRRCVPPVTLSDPVEMVPAKVVFANARLGVAAAYAQSIVWAPPGYCPVPPAAEIAAAALSVRGPPPNVSVFPDATSYEPVSAVAPAAAPLPEISSSPALTSTIPSFSNGAANVVVVVLVLVMVPATRLCNS